MNFNFFKGAKHFFYVSIIFLLVACSNHTQQSGEDTGLGRPKDLLESIISESDSIYYDLSYVGILPCKDCGGVKTTLKLCTRSNNFSLKEEFLKTDIAPSITLGSFNTERGFEQDQDATLYVLNDELPEIEHLYFARETGKNDILLKLDNSKQRTNHTNFTLQKVTE